MACDKAVSRGVTGTRGKTTTTCMIAEILKKAGKKILLGGNIRGVSTLAQLPDAEKTARAEAVAAWFGLPLETRETGLTGLESFLK